MDGTNLLLLHLQPRDLPTNANGPGYVIKNKWYGMDKHTEYMHLVMGRFTNATQSFFQFLVSAPVLWQLGLSSWQLSQEPQWYDQHNSRFIPYGAHLPGWTYELMGRFTFKNIIKHGTLLSLLLGCWGWTPLLVDNPVARL